MKKINVELTKDELMYIIEALGNTNRHQIKESLREYVYEESFDYTGLKDESKILLDKMDENGCIDDMDVYDNMISQYKDNFN